MHTLAVPPRPVKQARALAYGLALACTTLTPLPSHAFTYDTQASPVVIQHQSTGTPLVICARIDWFSLDTRCYAATGGSSC